MKNIFLHIPNVLTGSKKTEITSRFYAHSSTCICRCFAFCYGVKQLPFIPAGKKERAALGYNAAIRSNNPDTVLPSRDPVME